MTMYAIYDQQKGKLISTPKGRVHSDKHKMAEFYESKWGGENRIIAEIDMKDITDLVLGSNKVVCLQAGCKENQIRKKPFCKEHA